MSEKKYNIQRVDETEEPEDPLDYLPDVSEQTGGLPIVTFVLICLAACSVMLVKRIIAASSILVIIGCIALIFILVFGIIALVRGMFRKLHIQKEPSVWYAVSAAVMAAGCILGAVIGIAASF